MVGDEEFKEFSFKQGVSKEEIEKYQSAVLGHKDIEIVVAKLVQQCIFTKQYAENLKTELDKKYPLSTLLSTFFFDSKGSFLRKQDPGSDVTSDLFFSARQNFQLQIDFAKHFLLQKFLEKFNKEAIVSYLINRSLFKNSVDRIVLEESIQALFDNDYLKFSHVVAPMCENIVRSWAKDIGVYVYQNQNNVHGWKYRSLDRLLDDMSEEAISASDSGMEQVIFFIKLCLSNVDGFNMRNRVAHGINQIELQIGETFIYSVYNAFTFFFEKVKVEVNNNYENTE